MSIGHTPASMLTCRLFKECGLGGCRRFQDSLWPVAVRSIKLAAAARKTTAKVQRPTLFAQLTFMVALCIRLPSTLLATHTVRVASVPTVVWLCQGLPPDLSEIVRCTAVKSNSALRPKSTRASTSRTQGGELNSFRDDALACIVGAATLAISDHKHASNKNVVLDACTPATY